MTRLREVCVCTERRKTRRHPLNKCRPLCTPAIQLSVSCCTRTFFLQATLLSLQQAAPPLALLPALSLMLLEVNVYALRLQASPVYHLVFLESFTQWHVFPSNVRQHMRGGNPLSDNTSGSSSAVDSISSVHGCDDIVVLPPCKKSSVFRLRPLTANSAPSSVRFTELPAQEVHSSPTVRG